MANIAENTLYAYSENNQVINIIKNFIEENFDYCINYIEENQLELVFDSSWEFPEEEMDELYSLIKNFNNFYIRVLSLELCNHYHALFYCDETTGGWVED